tara:strand:- start:212 stop:379 length:168 start_codon:yes stop_codon:yes gene_type:complete
MRLIKYIALNHLLQSQRWFLKPRVFLIVRTNDPQQARASSDETTQTGGDLILNSI